jgi:hypothetical protein
VSDDGTEIHLRQEVYSLQESYELSSRHIAILPKKFFVSSVSISLIELDANGAYIKV